MPHVVVIGAGTAGLTVARQLSQVPGFKTTVLEATSRIGGRIRAVELNDVVVDLGASWMHETRFNPLFDEALKRHWKLRHTDMITKFYTEKGEIPQKAGIAQILHDIESVVAEYFHQEKPLLPTEPPLKEFVKDIALKNAPLITEKEKHWAELMYRQVEHFIGQKWSEIPAGEGGEQSPLGRDAFVYGKGYQYVLDWIQSDIKKENVDIQLNEPVVQINGSDSHYEISTESSKYTADYVVCTIPLGALKKHPSLFDDSRPDMKPALDLIQKTIKSTGLAALGKVIVEFPSVKWEKDVDSFCVANEETGELVSIINPFCFDEQHPVPVLMALTGPGLTEKVEANPEDAFSKIEWAFRAVFKHSQMESPTNVVVSDWTQNPFFGCSYSARNIGQSYDDLVDPFIEGADRLRFAGEHTTLDGNGCVHGAYLSGIREAEYIIEHHNGGGCI